MPTHLSGLSPDSSFVNFAQVFRRPFSWEDCARYLGCSYCGREPRPTQRGAWPQPYSCDGCGAAMPNATGTDAKEHARRERAAGRMR